MSSPNGVCPNYGDARLKLSNKVTALNPNAAEFVPSSLRSTLGSSTLADVNRSNFHGPSGKTILDRSESSKSNNSDDEAHQFWRRQLPDDIIPDFTTIEKDEQNAGELSLASLSLNAGAVSSSFFGPAVSKLSREFQDLPSHNSEDLRVGNAGLNYGDNSQASFLNLASNNWEQNFVDSLHFTNGKEEHIYNGNNSADFVDSSTSEYATVTDAVIDPLEYLVSEFPGFSAESLAELYYANGCDFNLTIEILTQLEMQVDSSTHQNLNLGPTSPSFSTVDFPALPSAEDQNGLLKGNTDIHGVLNGCKSSIVSSGTGDFVSAVRRLASQDSGHWKLEKKGMEYGNDVSSGVLPKQYSSSTKLQSAGSTRAAPVWLETGNAVANMYSESRGEARDFARVRNACFEQARQAYLIGNKALAKELSAKGQLYNMQMKAAHEKAKEAIYRQRNPVASEHGRDRLIDLHGLHVSEAIQILRVELASLRSAARSTGERIQFMVCVGTGHHTKGSRTARLPVAVEQFLLEEGLHYTQPQPGLLRVVLY